MYVYFTQKKEASQISVDIKSNFTNNEGTMNVEAYDHSPKTNGRISISPSGSTSFKESSA